MIHLVWIACLVASSIAQHCQPVNQLMPNPARYFERNKDQFPTDIFRVFQGSLSAQCDQLPQLFQRDPTLCLTDKFGAQKCNLCAPSPQGQFFKYPFWSEFNAIKEESPLEYGGSEARVNVTHCMRCFAWALPYNASLNGNIPLDTEKDIIKDSVTVSTRIAVAEEKSVEQGGVTLPVFQQPDKGQLEALDSEMEAEGLANHPCVVYLAVLGPTGRHYCQFSDYQQRQRRVAGILARKEAYIQSFAMMWKGDAVNAHKEALMEIPFGQMHLIQARVSAKPGYEGWSADDPLQLNRRFTYKQINPSGRKNGRAFYGSAIYEYGMVVASPGQVRTACWLTPLFEDQSARDNWIKSERKKEVDLQEKAFTAVRDNLSSQSDTAAGQCKGLIRSTQRQDPNILRFCLSFCAQQDALQLQGLESRSGEAQCNTWKQLASQGQGHSG